ncbi:MAG: hypothetical protein Q7V01_13560 [Vicinamibacterales bacterium]|nr:hypothetical protein [Vicinamibacterales bacterium]
MKTALLAMLLGTVALAQQPPANYDEAKVPAYTLPDLLVMSTGERVRSAADWTTRRTEVLALLESQMFGRAPAQPGAITVSVDGVDKAALGGTAFRKHVTIAAAGRRLRLLLYLPAKAARPVPVFVGLGFGPNHTVHPDSGIPLAGTWVQDKATQAASLQPGQETSRGSAASRWQVETVLSRGYGLATVYYGDIEPDVAGALNHGVRGVFLTPGQHSPGDDEWGAIGAWAWGLSRVADYLGQDPDVDATRLALLGHSRLGKTALWAGATDSRFGIVIANNSGEGGAAISRRHFGETIADLNSRFPHWFCGHYRQYSGREEQMPFDAHMLLALIAPRPLYVASALEDQWADPRGEFLGAVSASTVYELLGRTGIGTTHMPPVNQPVGDAVRYHVRSGKHDITAYDWQQYLEFADRHFRHAPQPHRRSQGPG